jgi:hypothetical protein
VQPTWWTKFWTKIWPQYNSDPDRAINYITTLDETQVVDVVSSALGRTLAAHQEFRERRGSKYAAAANANANIAEPDVDDVQDSCSSSVIPPLKTSTLLEVVVDPPRRCPDIETNHTASNRTTMAQFAAARTATLKRRVPELNARLPSNVQKNETVQLELEEIRHQPAATNRQLDFSKRPSVKQILTTVKKRILINPDDSVESDTIRNSTKEESPESGTQRPGEPRAAAHAHDAPPPFDEEDLKLAKRRQERTSARAAMEKSQQGVLSISAAAAIALPESGTQRTAVDHSPGEPRAAAHAHDAPPPFDEEDLKLAKRRQERTAARAAMEKSQQGVLSISAAAAIALPESGTQRPGEPRAAAHAHDAPPPFDEEDLKLAKRRQAKALTRSALT